MEIILLAIRDDEQDSKQDVGDEGVMLSDVAEGGQRGNNFADCREIA